MSTQQLAITDSIYDYLLAVSSREPPVLARLREETSHLPMAIMQISPPQAQLMALLVKLIGAKRIVEVGVFTGYSSIAMAMALPKDGRLVALDVSQEWTEIAKRYWREAGVADRIDLKLGPALETMDALIAAGAADSFDLCFIDADKVSYAGYFERALVLIRRGGLIMIDNTLFGGHVADQSYAGSSRASVEAIRTLNSSLRDDQRIDLAMLAIGDGLTLARKR